MAKGNFSSKSVAIPPASSVPLEALVALGVEAAQLVEQWKRVSEQVAGLHQQFIESDDPAKLREIARELGRMKGQGQPFAARARAIEDRAGDAVQAITAAAEAIAEAVQEAAQAVVGYTSDDDLLDAEQFDEHLDNEIQEIEDWLSDNAGDEDEKSDRGGAHKLYA